MKPIPYKRVIGGALISVHLLMVVCYLTPYRLMNEVLTYWGTIYCFPMWHMSAQLFAPAGESYAEWSYETDACDWEPLHFLEQRGFPIEKNLQFRISQLIAYHRKGVQRNEQLCLAAPTADAFRLIKINHSTAPDTTFFTIPCTAQKSKPL
jgi:hypothetical protein